MDEQTTPGTAEAVDGPDVGGHADAGDARDGGEGVDFTSRQAERGKMRLWLTAFTAAAALAVLAVVSVSAMRAG